MLAALRAQMPSSIQWTEPWGGMFLWLTLPAQLDATALLASALQQQTAFVPGAAFYANGGGVHTLRLNFSHATPERIEEGIRRLRRAMNL